MAVGSLRMLGYWNCWFSHFVAGVGGTIGVAQGKKKASRFEIIVLQSK